VKGQKISNQADSCATVKEEPSPKASRAETCSLCQRSFLSRKTGSKMCVRICGILLQWQNLFEAGIKMHWTNIYLNFKLSSNLQNLQVIKLF
jgi:hypothetical protein